MILRITLDSSRGYYLDECLLLSLTKVAFLEIRNLVYLIDFPEISARLHFVKCLEQSLIHVIPKTGLWVWTQNRWDSWLFICLHIQCQVWLMSNKKVSAFVNMALFMKQAVWEHSILLNSIHHDMYEQCLSILGNKF